MTKIDFNGDVIEVEIYASRRDSKGRTWHYARNLDLGRYFAFTYERLKRN